MSISNSEQKRFEYMSKPTKLLRMRMKLKLSQTEVADALSLSRIHYGNIEKGIRLPKTKLAEGIAEYFKTTVSNIFKKEDETHYVVKK